MCETNHKGEKRNFRHIIKCGPKFLNRLTLKCKQNVGIPNRPGLFVAFKKDYGQLTLNVKYVLGFK